MLPLAVKAAGVAVMLATVGGLGVPAWVCSTPATAQKPMTAPCWQRPPPHRRPLARPVPVLRLRREAAQCIGSWESGVHTHADGIVHIHPFQTFEEGSGASLVRWFEYGGGKLTNTSIKLPQSSVREWKNGDLCPDGEPGEVQASSSMSANPPKSA
jgi:hypothetical protein